MKLCTKCRTEKSEDNFWKSKRGKGGLDFFCIECRRKEAKLHRNRAKLGLIDRTKGRPARKVPEGMKWCSIGQHITEIANFNFTERSCRKCKSEAHIRRKYGLTKDDYDNMVKSQNGKCAICLYRDIQYVDHSHSTGKVRGLLCACCNSAIGMLDENPEIFHRAVDYIARNE